MSTGIADFPMKYELEAASDQLRADVNVAFTCVLGFPPAPAAFEREIRTMLQGTSTDPTTLVRVISLANAALTVSEAADIGVYASWYRDRAKDLLQHAAAIAIAHEAMAMRDRDATVQ